MTKKMIRTIYWEGGGVIVRKIFKSMLYKNLASYDFLTITIVE